MGFLYLHLISDGFVSKKYSTHKKTPRHSV
jgi:hypothetical protein